MNSITKYLGMILGVYCAIVLCGNSSVLNNHINVEFDVAMLARTTDYYAKYSGNSTQMSFNRSLLAVLKNLYKQHAQSAVHPQEEPRIPRIIHQIWVGGKPLPAFYAELVKTWKAHHPDWIYILWTDKEVAELRLHNQELYNRAQSLSEKANILRYELLYRMGGVYVDIDFECLKPLDVLHHSFDFYTGITPNNARAVLANGIIAARAHHPLLSLLIRAIPAHQHQSDQVGRNGVQYFSKICYEYLKNSHQEKNIAFPTTYFYPFKKHYGTRIDALDFIRPESYAIHYWGKTLEEKITLYNQKR